MLMVPGLSLHWLWPLAVSDCGVRGHVACVHRGWHSGAVAAHRWRRAAVQCRVCSRAAHPRVDSVNRATSMCTCQVSVVLCFLFLHVFIV